MTGLGVVFLAFATIFPHVTFRLFLLIPVKVKWLLLTAVGYLLTIESKRECNGIGSALGCDCGLRDVSPFFAKDLIDELSESAKKVLRRNFRRNKSRLDISVHFVVRLKRILS